MFRMEINLCVACTWMRPGGRGVLNPILWPLFLLEVTVATQKIIILECSSPRALISSSGTQLLLVSEASDPLTNYLFTQNAQSDLHILSWLTLRISWVTELSVLAIRGYIAHNMLEITWSPLPLWIDRTHTPLSIIQRRKLSLRGDKWVIQGI